ncbi:hypothetical protein ACR2WG_26700, partial [Klebsiella pneumoniae]
KQSTPMNISGSSDRTLSQSLPQPNIQCQQDNNYIHGQGFVMEGNICEEANLPVNISMFSQQENRFDHRKVLNSQFEANPNDNFPLMFASPFYLPSVDYPEHVPGVPRRDTFSKPDVSIWF